MIQKKHSILITNCFYSKFNRTAVIIDRKFSDWLPRTGCRQCILLLMLHAMVDL
jgi:hypothetical protein